MERGDQVLFADLVVDFLAIGGFLYLFSRGYFSNLDGRSLNDFFLKTGVVGLIMVSITIYLLLKRE